MLTENLIKNLLNFKIECNIVVVDNDSTNDSYNYLYEKYNSHDDICVIETGKNLGYSGGNNYGINHICSINNNIKYIAILNPDVEIISSDIFNNLTSALKDDSKLAAVTALTLLNDIYEFPNSACYKYNNALKVIFQNVFFFKNFINDRYERLNCNNNLAYVHKVQGCFFVIKKDVFYDLGLFDDKVFLYFEEEILAMKIKNRGMRCGVLVSELIKHNHQQKDDEYLDLKKRKFHNDVMLDSKKYYMLNYMKVSRAIWRISNIIDRFTRAIKTFYLFIKNRK